MLSKPKHGWTTFNIGSFCGNPSYLTDVPVDFLDGMLQYYRNGSAAIWFNEEGSEFTLVLNPYSVFIIIERENEVCQRIDETPKQISEMLINDIMKNLDEWITWPPEMEFENGNYYQYRKTLILDKIDKLKKVMR